MEIFGQDHGCSKGVRIMIASTRSDHGPGRHPGPEPRSSDGDRAARRRGPAAGARTQIVNRTHGSREPRRVPPVDDISTRNPVPVHGCYR